MTTVSRITLAVVFAAMAACSRGGQKTATPKPKPQVEEREKVQDKPSRGLPKGYSGRTDDAKRSLREVFYRRRRDRFEITTGPAHIVYARADTISGEYIVASTFAQRAAPAHPEAFGLFIGGSMLDGMAQRYGYYMARGTGEFTVKVRDGEQVHDLVPWTSDPAVPKQDSSGQAIYRLAIRVGADSVRFLSGGKRVAAVARSAIPTDGIFGIRVNHDLQVTVDEVRRSRQ